MQSQPVHVNPTERSFVGLNARFMSNGSLRPRKLFARNKSMNHGSNSMHHHMERPCDKKKKLSLAKKLALLLGGAGSYILFLVMLFAIIFIAILAVSLGYWSGRKIVDYTHKHAAVGAFAHLNGDDLKQYKKTKKHVSPKYTPACKVEKPRMRHVCDDNQRKYSVNHQLIKLYN